MWFSWSHSILRLHRVHQRNRETGTERGPQRVWALWPLYRHDTLLRAVHPDSHVAHLQTRASSHPGRPRCGHLGQAWLGLRDPALLSCLGPLEQWLGPRMQKAGAGQGQRDLRGSQVLEWGWWAEGAVTPSSPGRSSEDLGPSLLSAAGDQHVWARPHHTCTPLGSVPPPSSQSEAELSTDHCPPSRLLPRSPQTEVKEEAARPGRLAFQSAWPWP